MLGGDDQITQVQQATDIIDLIGRQIRITPRGKEFVGLCPFHDDSKPSLNVSPAKQIYKCFACGAGGNVFSWMTNYHKMSFREALEFLADRAGIKLKHQRTDAQQAQTADERQLIAEANRQALGFFETLLRHETHGRQTRSYLAQRGIKPEMVEAFQLGYAPDRWDGLVQTIAANRWNAKAFNLAGLISSRSQSEGEYDRLRHRLIFPICDALGRAIAFGGRMLEGGSLDDPSDAKYLNTSQTAVFNKSATLYGLHLAKKPIIDSRQAVIVEGYTDVIACHQSGFNNVVAALGTAFTLQHVQALRHFCDRLVLVFDADAAGQKAADRAVEILLTGSLDVAVAILPQGLDPDALLATDDGARLWTQLIAEAADALDYQFERLHSAFEAAATLAGRQRLAEDYIRRLGQMGLGRGSMIRRAMIMNKLASLLHLSERQVGDMIRRVTTSVARPPSSTTPVIGPDSEKIEKKDVALTDSAPKIKALRLAERQIIGGLLREPALFHQALADGRTLKEAVTPAHMISTEARRLYQLLYDQLGHSSRNCPQPTLASVVGQLAAQADQPLVDLATQAEAQVEQMTDHDEEQLTQLIRSATGSLLSYHDQQTYRQLQTTSITSEPDQRPPSEDERLQRTYDYLRANPSGARIARL